MTAPKYRSDRLGQRIEGRIAYLRDVGRVKDPQLLEEALQAIDALVATTEALLTDMGSPDDGIEANLMEACRAAIAQAQGK